MKNNYPTLIAKIFAIAITLAIAACASKKNTATSKSTKTTEPVAATAPPPSTTPPPAVKSPDGIYPPGNDELTAVKIQFPDATLDKLKEGHVLYTQSACIGCHGPINIYNIPTANWKQIIGDMAQRARITDSQRDAVYKYVMAIKATQPK